MATPVENLHRPPRPLQQVLDEHVIMAAELVARVVTPRDRPHDPVIAEALDLLCKAVATRKLLTPAPTSAPAPRRSAA